MRTLFSILTFLGFKKKYLILKEPLNINNSLFFKNFFNRNEFEENNIYAINMNDIVIFSLFNKISLSFPVTLTFVYSYYYNPPEMYGGFRSQLPKHYKYSQRLINTYENNKPTKIKYKKEYENITYIN